MSSPDVRSGSRDGGTPESRHGGGVRAAARRWGHPVEDWLDLSTGINPRGWPVPPLPPQAWTRLPEADDGLEAAAAAYYGSNALLPLPGSQAAIQALPVLWGEGTGREQARVGVLHPGYNEHARAWSACGHAVQPVEPEAGAIEAVLDALDVLVLIHPNNPTGTRFEPAQLREWHARLARRGGWLVVDEAFVDSEPQLSLVPEGPRDGLVVLRSLGKFFGLAGARVGFVFAPEALRRVLSARLGPWSVPGPSRQVAAGALADHGWQSARRMQLAGEGERLAGLLRAHGLAPDGGTALFQWVRSARAEEIQDRLARAAILVRRFDEPASLRFGLPGDEAGWRRLEAALSELSDD
ncbi:threonine-phosphate decarboxylase CobD [Thioalkalivibrio sp. ALE19]|uniref:threonine-phosphate decarboxylase CobD n=1 Tax=Thioalkalivibrio sp. ALE19 TaxID=1266909 RepID=UPI000426F417|nr:threonine-phosphate decarboxylase CobD [Thioalkalivibrio sp. ALE19]